MSYTFTNCAVTGGFSYVGRLVSFFSFLFSVNGLYAGLGWFGFDTGFFCLLIFFFCFDFRFGCVLAVSTLLLPLNTLPMNLFPCLMSLYVVLVMIGVSWSNPFHLIMIMVFDLGLSSKAIPRSPVCFSLFIKAAMDGQLRYTTSPLIVSGYGLHIDWVSLMLRIPIAWSIENITRFDSWCACMKYVLYNYKVSSPLRLPPKAEKLSAIPRRKGIATYSRGSWVAYTLLDGEEIVKMVNSLGKRSRERKRS